MGETVNSTLLHAGVGATTAGVYMLATKRGYDGFDSIKTYVTPGIGLVYGLLVGFSRTRSDA